LPLSLGSVQFCPNYVAVLRLNDGRLKIELVQFLPSPNVLLQKKPGAGDPGGADATEDATQTMSKEHAAAFKRVMEKRRIIWCDYAAAFQVMSQPYKHTRHAQPMNPSFCGTQASQS
jgi:hypothetical protein